MDVKSDLDALMATIAARKVRLVRKDQSKFWRFLGWVITVVTFGANKSFVSDFATTIGHTIGLPGDWDQYPDISKLELLTHELHHVDQYDRLTVPWMGFLYLFIVFPIGLSYFRYRFEREAYVVGFKKTLQYLPQLRADCVNHGVEALTGGNYGYAWPFKKAVRAYFETNL